MKYDPQDKYRRMIRAFDALKRMATNMGPVGSIDYGASDLAIDFFTECYHLKDWLKKDSRVRPSDVEAFVTSSTALSIAGDICNSEKHAGLDRPPKAAASIVQVNTALTVMMPRNVPAGSVVGQVAAARTPRDGDTVTLQPYNGPQAFARAEVFITLSTGRRDGLALATECVDDWNRFLKSKGIHFSLGE